SNESPKRINIFTTNYDLVLERIFDDFLVDNPLIYFNDGSRGFFQKYINNKNFYLNVTHSGYNDNFRREVPTINLFKLHGSISWLIEKGKENQERIIVSEHNYYITKIRDFLNKMNLSLEDFRDIFNSSLSKEIGNVISNLNKQVAALNIDERKWREFYDKYTNLSIINPDKYKFSKTVLEQHYYQLIRSFSYELEKKQSVLIVFGFSFADEHIRDIFERSLLNPELLVILISYSASGQQQMKKMYEGYSNIIFLPLDFNEQIGDFKYLLYLLGDSNAK
ncbi:SIR2 family protein, partial [Staphylococcus pseudintermedius]|nr:SIR2 family protein [Staphylococcus pseudintermedius]